MTTVADFSSLESKLKNAHTLRSIAELLGWDELVNLPPESVGQRQEQSALMAKLCHEADTDPEFGPILDTLEKAHETLSDAQRIVVREKRKEYDRLVKLPSQFVEKRAKACSEGYHAWADAKAKSDFATFAPFIEKHIQLSLEYANYLGWGDKPYDLLIDDHDPGMDTASIETLFEQLKNELVPIVQQILDSPTKANPDIFKSFPVDKQEAFLKEVTASLGFNYKRGRIDTSLHPFCGGNGADSRMTTRFHEDNPMDSLFSSIHETGHGLYEQGLPLDQLHTALGQAAGMGAHESQSRLWENQVSRSKGFWNHYEPKLRAAFPVQLGSITSDDLYLAVNSVNKNPIRVDSDEVTYNLHIIIRFEIEKKLFSGELKVADLPEYWNAQYKAYLGIDPENDVEGVLQDVHWSGGAFGYFPSYCLGNMLAAQLWYTAQEQLPGLESDFESGKFDRLLDWLRTNVHCHGRRYDLKELTQAVTGQELSPASLVRYLKERYLPLYR